MERTTKEIETPIGKHKVVLYEWATGGDKRALANAITEADKQSAMVQQLIVSIDGKTEDRVQALDAMHGQDFDTVFLALSEILIASSLAKKNVSN